MPELPEVETTVRGLEHVLKGRRIERIEASGRSVDDVTLDAPMLTGLVTGTREKRRRVPIEAIPKRMQEAVLAIEDRRFYMHPGIDPISLVGVTLGAVQELSAKVDALEAKRGQA